MRKLKAAICGLLAIATSLCLFACGEPEGEDDMNKVVLETGVNEISVEHHGRTVHGDAYIPDIDRFPLVVMSHGFNGYKDDFKAEAQLLMSENIGAITLTFCGSGARDTSGFPTTSMTLLTEKEDLLAVMDYAKNIKGFNGKLFLFGGSQGGMVSALAGHDRVDDLAGMLLLYPAFNIPHDWSVMYPTDESVPEVIQNWNNWGVDLGRNFVLSMRNLDAYEKMPQFTKPVLLMHGTNDTIVDISYIQRAETTYPDAELATYPAVHGFTPTQFNNAKQKMLEFFFNNL